MTTQIIFSQVPSYVPTNGLVGYWPFNGNANDQTPNGNNGTVNGASLTTDRFGFVNRAYNFNGISDNIKVLDNNTLDLTQTLTLSAWIQPNSSNNEQGIMGKGKLVNSTGYALLHNVSNPKKSGISTQDLPNFVSEAFINSTQLNNNTWYQLVGTYNGSELKLYINGILVTTTTTSIQLMPNSLTDFFIGCELLNYRFFNGKIDDVGVWNRALTQQEISTMYNGVNYSDTCNAVSGSLINGLVAYYPFCGNANDQSGNGLNGVVNGTTLTADRFGNINSAYSFNGVNNLIKVNHSSSFNTFPMSISLWCKGNSQYGALISKYTSCSSNNGWQLHTLGGKVSTYSYNFLGGAYLNCDGDANTIISDNNWYNIVSTYDLSGAKIYVNNVLVLSKPYIGIGSMSAPTNIQDLFIGTEINSISCSSYNTYYQGIIDDIGIWNRALTQQEITQLYNQSQCITNITVTDTLIINVGQLSYTNPVTYANNITIYPNPANTQVNISFNNITDLTGGNINIINSLGQQVATTPITLSGTNTTMPLNTWGGTGLYFVQILNAQGIVVDVKKIILQ